MTKLRSIAFNTLFYGNLACQLLVFSPIFFFVSEARAWSIVKRWARSSLWLLHRVAGARTVIAGRSNLPHGGAIIAPKHQSYWDVLALLVAVDRPAFILKKELMAVPLFGLYARRMAMIPVDRARRGGAVASIVEGAKKAVAERRQVIIFPEGTRTLPGAQTDYRQGVYRLYDALHLPVIPVALNSGVYWRRHGGERRAGTLRAEFLPSIEPGLARDVFLRTLRETIEHRTAELVAGTDDPADADAPDDRIHEDRASTRV